MRRDARKIRDGAVLDGDVCIVGGGPAGITVARELSGLATRVIWLESGGFEHDESLQSLNEGAFIGARYAGLRATRHRQVGGTAQIWNTPLNGATIGAKYVPLDPCDFRSPAGDDEIGWPFDHLHLKSFYERAQDVCGLGPFEYGGERWCDERATFALPDRRVQRAIYQFGSARRFTKSHLGHIISSGNALLVHHATARALTMHSGGRSATSIDVATLAGNRFRVRSRFFVVAAGAIENARLLLVSREPGQAAPGNEHDWLGRCFMEHPRDRSLSLTPRGPEVYAQSAFYDRHTAVDGTVIGGRIAVDPVSLVDERLPNASASLQPLVRQPTQPSGIFGQVSGRVRSLFGDKSRDGFGWSRTADPERWFAGFQLLLNTEQFPHPENRVLLARQVDELGVPRVEVHWKWRTRDQSNLERLRGVFREALTASEIGCVETCPDSAAPDPNAHHHAGTTRMHESERLGVVDADSRVHGTENLYVTGSSVFPTAGFANPTLTVVALALRLADHLKCRL